MCLKVDVKQFEKRASPLQQQTRVIKCFPDAAGFVASSTEGRVAVQCIAQKDKEYDLLVPF